MTKTTKVDGGMLHMNGLKIWVIWDKYGRETWTLPDEEQAANSFTDMAERWAA